MTLGTRGLDVARIIPLDAVDLPSDASKTLKGRDMRESDIAMLERGRSGAIKADVNRSSAICPLQRVL